jgi:2-polyprenyl-6-hydroxyphenyl methylase/3-demethylubiquinone-9 3-methyltransferase
MASVRLEDPIKKRDKMISKSRFHRANRALIEKVVKNIHDGRGFLLQIGCGYGDITKRYISPYCDQVIAVDLEKRFKESKIAENVTFRLMDARKLSFEDQIFDGIVAIEVIEYVKDDNKFISECLRVLKKDGILFFATPNRLRLSSRLRNLVGRKMNFPYSYGKDPVLGEILHIREYSREDLIDLINKFSIKDYKIKGIWLGIPVLQLGIVKPNYF